MQLNEKVNQYAVYKDNGELLGTAKVTLPEISYMTDSVKGAGVMGELDMPTLGMTESMEVSIDFRTLNSSLSSITGNKDGVNLNCKAAIELFDAGLNKKVIKALDVSIAAVPKKSALGDVEPATAMGSSITLEVWRLKITIDGKAYLHINKLSNVYEIEGKDLYADVRKAIGK